MSVPVTIEMTQQHVYAVIIKISATNNIVAVARK
jgi:hypothetical protein